MSSDPTAARRRRRALIDALEGRRLFALPAYSDQLGLTGLLDPTPTFEDDFDGSTLDASKWNIREGPRWRLEPNGAIEDMTWTTRDAVQVKDGELNLVAHNDPETGRIETGWIQSGKAFLAKRPEGIELPGLAEGYDGSFEQVFGYWEARMKFSSLSGQWAAFWVHAFQMTEIGKHQDKTNHPEIYGTEYDIAEHEAIRQGQPAAGQVSQVGHWNGYDQWHRAFAIHTETATLAPSYVDPSAYHVYGMLWTGTAVKFTIDGNVRMVLTDPAAISKIPHTMILSTEAGEAGALEPDKGSNGYFGPVPAGGYGSLETSRARTVVDYVRVWKLTGQPTTPINTSGATIEGFAYQDLDKDAIWDKGTEPTLSGRTIYLDLNNSGTPDADEPTRVTDASGKYVFSGLPAGKYTVRQVLDASWPTQTAPRTTAEGAISMSGPVRASVDFGLIGGTVVTPPPPPPTTNAASATGSVWNDANGNGTRDSGEAGMGDVLVYLDANMNQRRDAGETLSVRTTADGTYRLDGLPAGAWIPIRIDLSGTTNVLTAPSGDGSRWIQPSAGQTTANVTFGVRATVATGGGTTMPTTPPATGGSATGNVFVDANKNGTRDAGEGVAADVLVYLDLNMNQRRDAGETLTARTLADGSYRLDGLPVGAWLALRIDLTGTTGTQTAPGGVGTQWINPAIGAINANVNFGVSGLSSTTGGGTGGTTPPPPTTSTLGSVTGIVFSDANKNGTRDAGEGIAANVLVYLDTNMNQRRDAAETISVRTAADGTYRLDGLPVGAWVPIRVDLSGTTMTLSAPTGDGSRWIQPAAGGTTANIAFGVYGYSGGTTTPSTGATVSGSVFFDTNRNGVRDAGETAAPAGTIVYVDYNMNGRRDGTDAFTSLDGFGAFLLANVTAINGLATRTSLSDTTYRMTTVQADGARWLNTQAGGTIANVSIGLTPR